MRFKGIFHSGRRKPLWGGLKPRMEPENSLKIDFRDIIRRIN